MCVDVLPPYVSMQHFVPGVRGASGPGAEAADGWEALSAANQSLVLWERADALTCLPGLSFLIGRKALG